MTPNLASMPAPDGPPEQSSVEAIHFPDLQSSEVRSIAAAWQSWRGSRAIPPREAMSLRELGRLAVYVSLVRVLGDGEDYEFRIIGDAHVQAYGASYQGRLLSDVAMESPRFGRQLKSSYDTIRTTRRPLAFRGYIGRDVPNARFVWFETTYFPFGPSDDRVDHIVNAAVYGPRAGMWPG